MKSAAKGFLLFLYPTLIYIAFSGIATFVHWWQYVGQNDSPHEGYLDAVKESLKHQGAPSLFNDHGRFTFDPSSSIWLGIALAVNLFLLLYTWAGSVWLSLIIAGKKPDLLKCAKDCLHAYTCSYLVLLLAALVIFPLFDVRATGVYMIFLLFVGRMIMSTERRYSLGIVKSSFCVLVPWSAIIFLSRWIYESDIFEGAVNEIWIPGFNFLLMMFYTACCL